MLDVCIPVVFDRIVWSPQDLVRNFGPLIHRIPLKNEKDPKFLWTPITLLQQGIQLVVPAFTALFTDAILD